MKVLKGKMKENIKRKATSKIFSGGAITYKFTVQKEAWEISDSRPYLIPYHAVPEKITVTCVFDIYKCRDEWPKSREVILCCHSAMDTWRLSLFLGALFPEKW